ncbi:MAG: CehA/McbA family metallohydrolase [Thermoplasmatota archaeon]
MKIDLHLHSKYSGDSDIPPKRLVEVIESKGYGGLAIMDHNTLEGYRKIKDMDTNLIIIPGLEVSTREGHILAVGLQEEIGRQDSIKEAIEVINDHGALAIAAHPYRLWSGIGEKLTLNNTWDAIEGINGRSWRLRNLQAQKLAERMGLPVVGGSDSHRLKTVGKAYTIINNPSNWHDVVDAIKTGKTSIGGNHRTFSQTFFYVRRAVFGWIKRGGQRI